MVETRYSRAATGLGYGRALLVPIGLIVVAFIFAGILAAICANLQGVTRPGFFASSAATATGFAITAVGYLYFAGLGKAYIDYATPTKRSLSRGVGLGVVVFSLQAVIDGVGRLAGVSVGIDDVAEQAATSPAVLLGAIAINIVLVGIAEELFFRNVLQKRLSDRFGSIFAIGVVSLLFAPLHVGNFDGQSALAIAIPLISVFLASVVYGVAFANYQRLDIVAIGHGVNNSLVFLVVYALF